MPKVCECACTMLNFMNIWTTCSFRSGGTFLYSATTTGWRCLGLSDLPELQLTQPKITNLNEVKSAQNAARINASTLQGERQIIPGAQRKWRDSLQIVQRICRHTKYEMLELSLEACLASLGSLVPQPWPARRGSFLPRFELKCESQCET